MTVADPGQPQSPSTQAITALVLGLLGIIPCCCLFGPIAWFLANQELKAIRAGRSAATGEGITKAALILGILGTICFVGIVLWVLFWGGMAFLQALMHR